ncbi:MAG: DUF1045 domain-containing protein [Methanothrix sp.]|jgi:hypothetical protein|uniref:DUF1045 domain-containing protein n=1 Tax=Methanothrix TaxID=2222 RepID=UPI0025D2B8A2|nr:MULTISPECIES: DUF1045 domain-containing protein [Methanothrix]MBK7386371.1 DUF1045 domain-containing protein [Methanothrix sp.]HPY93077.1 DUF1045 domain-containing protein [Methanothrix soehngenii]
MNTIISFLTNYWFYVFATALVTLILALIWKRRLRRIKFLDFELEFGADSINENNPHHMEKNPSQIFARSDSSEFTGCFEKLAGKARRIILIGIGINILHHDTIIISLMDRVKKGECNLEIYLANPFSPAVEMRLIEEEIGDMKPPVGKVGLINRLNSIIEEQKKNPSNFVLKLFSHYPTFAMFIIDDDYFFYPYGYALLGNLSPVSHFSKSNSAHTSMIEFLARQYENVKASSAEAQLVFDAQMCKPVSVEKFLSFAVYLVPNDSSEIYRFGSKVLGYDVRKSCTVESDWSEYVGFAADFGFHLTIADVLYYPCQRDIDLLCKTVEFVAQELHPFSLSAEIKERFPNDSSISLVCHDKSGTLESMHYEMVFRCYRQAVASNYSLGLSSCDRDSSLPRDDLMIKRYHAPYILQRFNPHFTLLTEVPPDKMDEVARELKEIYETVMKKEQQILINDIAIMVKSQPDRPWQIKQRIQLR